MKMLTKPTSLLSIATLVLAGTLTASAALAASHVVKMNSISYEPKKLEMKAGDSVVWQNVAYTQHSATSEEVGAFDTGLIEPKAKSKAVVLTKAGTYPYHCSIHGKTMHAEIVVKE